ANANPVFRAAEAQHLHARLPRDFLRRDPERRHGVGKPRAVHVHAQAELPRDAPKRLEFVRRVNRGDFRGLCQREGARFRVMNVGAPGHRAFDRGGFDLPLSPESIRTLVPFAKNSGAPHSETSTCAISWQRMLWYGWQSDASDSELADVPLNTKNTSHFVSKTSRMRSDAFAVHASSP